MAKKKRKARKPATPRSSGGTAYPYTTKPAALRRFLGMIPQKPRPSKVNSETLKAWGLKDTNDQTILRVLKAVGLINPGNEPLPLWTEFQKQGTGAGALGRAIKVSYAKIFEHANEPYRETDETLRNYFNIVSSGSEDTILRQMQTFKVLCEHADFKGVEITGAGAAAQGATGTSGAQGSTAGAAAVHIDLHIHLPENKTRRDYEYIFEDIARYIFGRDIAKSPREES